MSDAAHRDPVAHRKLTVIETDDASTLDRLFADPELRPLLWLRVGARRALVDPQAVRALRDRLTALGLPPRFTSELSD